MSLCRQDAELYYQLWKFIAQGWDNAGIEKIISLLYY